MITHRVDKIIAPNLKERHLTKYVDLSPVIEQQEKSIINKMEQVWKDYFALPKEERNGIEWDGEKLRPAVFDDIYLAQCDKEVVTPNEQIFNHFWDNCVAIQDYVPKFCKNDIPER